MSERDERLGAGCDGPVLIASVHVIAPHEGAKATSCGLAGRPVMVVPKFGAALR